MIPSEALTVRYRSTGRVHLHVPPTAGSGPVPTVCALHGYGMDPLGLLAYVSKIVPHAIVLAPEGPSGFYLGPPPEGEQRPGVGHAWVAERDRALTDERNDAFLEAALSAVAERHPLDPKQTVLLGYSQGVGVATHFFVNHPEIACGLAGLAGGVTESFRPRLSALRGKPVFWITGSEDEGYPPEYSRAVHEAWRQAGADLDASIIESGHHVRRQAREPLGRWLEARIGPHRTD